MSTYKLEENHFIVHSDDGKRISDITEDGNECYFCKDSNICPKRSDVQSFCDSLKMNIPEA